MSYIKKITKYVEEMANELGLGHWTFDVRLEDSPDEEGILAFATNKPTLEVHYSEITLLPLFSAMGRKMQRRIIIHELLHCHFASSQDLLGLDHVLPPEAVEVYDSAASLLEEMSVDLLAGAISKRFPLPPKMPEVE